MHKVVESKYKPPVVDEKKYSWDTLAPYVAREHNLLNLCAFHLVHLAYELGQVYEEVDFTTGLFPTALTKCQQTTIYFNLYKGKVCYFFKQRGFSTITTVLMLL